MEIIWEKIYSDEKLALFHAKFWKMEIIKMVEINDKQQWLFSGCYVLNIKYKDKKELSDYHFYTIDYFLDEGIKLMCIQPLFILDKSKNFDNDKDIDQRIFTWFKNCQQKFKTGYDVLGQRHGAHVTEYYQNLQNENEVETDFQITKETQKKEIKRKLDQVIDSVWVATKLYKDEVVEILLKSKKVTISEIFS